MLKSAWCVLREICIRSTVLVESQQSQSDMTKMIKTISMNQKKKMKVKTFKMFFIKCFRSTRSGISKNYISVRSTVQVTSYTVTQ